MRQNDYVSRELQDFKGYMNYSNSLLKRRKHLIVLLYILTSFIYFGLICIYCSRLSILDIVISLFSFLSVIVLLTIPYLISVSEMRDTQRYMLMSQMNNFYSEEETALSSENEKTDMGYGNSKKWEF